MIKTTSHYNMGFTEDERKENLRLLKEELLKIDPVAQFKEMGCDINIVNGSQHKFYFDIVKDNRLVGRLDMGKLSYTKKQPNGSSIEIFHTKTNLEEQLKNNTPFLPLTVRMELDMFRYFLKHEPIETNPLYTKEEKLMHKMNNIQEKNNELLAELSTINNDGRLLDVLGDTPHLRETFKGEELNNLYQCSKFKPNDTYHKYLLSVKDGESNLIIREIEHEGKPGFVGAVMTYKDGLHSLQTFKPIQKLDRAALREILDRPNPLYEMEPEPVKSNVVPFEKPQEEPSGNHDLADYDDAPDEPEQQKRKARLKP
ncbi:hypothetical protein GR140_19255 [Pseudomonas putida]|uniref:hypothetical protein n=1 Tax=Pseudomonas putida TaxID=303 RepID=UPI001BAFB7E3|nr:hypothetical protein [Pseudomonas putida]QUG90805.1 hypothetical protein GR140_19255 [Pseudomonas putida]